MKTDKNKYSKMVKERSPGSHVAKNCRWAFCIGGAICVLGEALYAFYKSRGFIISDARLLASVTLVAISAFLTATGKYGKLAKRAGAGTLVPITGFANAVIAPAIDNKAEGLVLGLGAKIFIVAGPVILYGTSASALYGAVLWIVSLFG